MSAGSDSPLAGHLDFLRRRIFQVDTKWPHYDLLLRDVSALAESTPEGSRVAVLERAYVYGGDSLFAPLFDRHEVRVVDCQIPTSEERDGFQKSWTEDPSFVRYQADARRPITDTGLPNAWADLVLVPNVVHHEPDQPGLFRELKRVLRPGGRGYIFEALLRELHQIPDDYLRYTPFGLAQALEDVGLKSTGRRSAGGPFEAIAYCWIQALQYIPPAERQDREAWFFEQHLPELLELDRRYPENLDRSFTSFPVAFAVDFERPVDRP